MCPPPQLFCCPWIATEEAEEEEGVGLHFSLQFERRNRVLDPIHASSTPWFRVPVSILLSCIGWGKNKEQGNNFRVFTEHMAAVAAAAAAALTLSLAGFLVSDRRPRRRPRNSLRRMSSSEGPLALPSFNDGLRIVANEEPLGHVIHGASIRRSALIRCATDGTDMASATGNDIDMPGANGDERREDGQPEMEQEIERLRHLSHALLERESKLELQMLEYYGLKEQEAAMRELENRVNVASMEARLLTLEIESLQEENQRLKTQVSSFESVKAKLDCTKDKIKNLKKKLRSDAEEARRTTASLRERITELEKENADAKCQLAWASDMEQEAAELRKANARLEEENSELALRLENAQKIACSINKVLEEDILEENNHLRETNDELSKEIEQLRSDHCAQVEELVYLKWVNACLRYELRNYHPSQGHMTAKDLNKSVSYRSREKAKRLMVEYCNLGIDLRENPPAEFDFEVCSPSEPSCDNPRNNAASEATVATKTGKLKLLGNIKKLVTGKGGHHRNMKSPKVHSNSDGSRWPTHPDVLESNSLESTSSCPSAERTPTSSVATVESHVLEHRRRSSITVPGLRRLDEETARSRSDLGTSYYYGREAARYHALRPEHPAEHEEFLVPSKHDQKRRAEIFQEH